MLFVEKFGGSSLAGVERVRCAARLIADTVRAGHSVAAVLSAQGKTTDALLSTAAHYSRSPSKRELDMLLATGEQASVALMAMTLEEMGLPAVSLTGWQAGVGTDETYGDAHIRRLSMERVRRELDEGKVVLIAGFQGVSPGNDITTLGRGGSDTTAVAAAAALRADECRIYTDVEGVFTADPRLIPEARRLSAVDSEEMLRLASLGSQGRRFEADTDAGTYSNISTDAFSVSAITAAQARANGFETPDGLPFLCDFDTVLISPELEEKAKKMFGENSRLMPMQNPDDNTNAANPVYGMRYIVMGGGADGFKGKQWAVCDRRLMKEIVNIVYNTRPTVMQTQQDNPLVDLYTAYADFGVGWGDARQIIFGDPG